MTTEDAVLKEVSKFIQLYLNSALSGWQLAGITTMEREDGFQKTIWINAVTFKPERMK